LETYFNTKELGEYLHIAEQSIRRWVFNDEIPYHRIHNVIRYRLSEIEKWVDENRDKLPPDADRADGGCLFDETETGEKTGGAV